MLCHFTFAQASLPYFPEIPHPSCNIRVKDFTEDEEAFYLSAVKRLRDGGLAKKAVNKLWKGVQRSPDARDALELLKKEIDFTPEAGAENQNRKREIRTGEVILSGQFI